MRALICHRPGGAFGFITDAWINALRSGGHQVQRWDGQRASWDDFKPDIYLGCSGHRQPIPADRRAKVAIHVNPYGPVDIPGIMESPQAIEWTLAQRPDAVFGYGHAEDRLLWSYWTERHGIIWVPMPTAGDKCVFGIPSTLEELEQHKTADVVYLGGMWSYKAQSLDPYLIPVLERPGLTCVVHGWGDWPSHYNVTRLGDDKVSAFFNSGRVAPCISEPHTQSYGFDLPERMFKVILSGALAIHDPVPGLARFISSIIVAQNPQQYSDLIWHYSRPENAEERLAMLRSQRAEVLANHTYHHRLAGLLRAVGFSVEADALLEV